MLEMFKVNEICSIDNVIIDAVVTYKTICDAECIVANQRLKCCVFIQCIHMRKQQ